MDSSGSSTCYGGGDLASAIILTIIFGVVLMLLLRWLYKKYWLNRRGTHLVQEDVETGKSAEYAFDNPAFKSEQKGGTSGGALDTKWTSKENGKAVDDSPATPIPTRNVSLRGSDFTGLGIELTGSLKEGIFVRKIASQGPAAGIVNIGDRITSITIDFRHIVLEDAAAILSYASPYNVRLDLAEGKPAAVTPSPKPGHASMTQPMGGTTSQSASSTPDQSAKKTLFPEEVDSKSSPVQIVQRENEKKSPFTQQVKGLIEEKLQTRNEPAKPRDEPDKEAPASPGDKSKGLKFGIRVLPPNVNEKIFGKSPTKVQADNENNANLEKNDTDNVKNQEMPPVAQKRKEKKAQETPEETFQRSDPVNSSGIKRDAAGIPQEVPDHMMQAAMSAKENRKSVVQDSGKKGKGKAPSPPPNETESEKDALNFTDNFVKENRPSANSTPKSERKKSPSDTESQIADRAGDSDGEEESSSHIELSANHITVHQMSDEEEGRRTASLGDLSKIETTKSPTSGRSNTATLERAQSLEITEQPGAVVTPKKRKAPAVDVDIFIEKEPRLSLDMGGGMEALRGRLKSANEWGNLEDAIYSIKDHADEEHSSDTESLNRSDEEQKVDATSNSLMKEIMAVADKFDAEARKAVESELPKKTMDQLLKEKLEEAQAALNDDTDLVPVVKPAIPKRSSLDTTVRNGNVKDTAKEDNVTYTPINVADSFGTNVPDDVKVSRYPFGSLERPKSDVLKKLMAQKIQLEERDTPVNRTTMTILPDEQLIDEPQPISLTLIGGGIESDKTESSQISPVYSSDNMGVNSISISSMEIPVQVETTSLSRIVPDADNVVTITTDVSQPSSIIMIDDECLDFTLQTPPPERTPSPVPQEEPETFVTEIRVQTPDKNHTQIKLTDEQDNFPRNSEIKFTTSTYESPGKVAEKRLSQIEQLRSNFEKSQQQSEIPVPVRKSSIPTLKLSPSKIPVFNSKGQDQAPQQRPANKVSVSVTSIKNSARHPSGK
ncbi:neurofilament heavy polypeptide-like [Phlebotomus argentipes]|uniref:neurofilament heavy polypeptide-like n=1 Tax=Phlebotomus argentipes TaxID=94469 RepID=UPI002893187F|nr:neurofilament heavy polypeptide-like [Phlebotomus argentipes]